MSTEVAAPAQATPAKAAKKPRSTGPKKPKAVASHPPVADMVRAAITSLKERGGSSNQAIKKYIAANFKVDADRLAPHIKKYLKSAVTKGQLVQTKGKGASGSFRLGAKPVVAKKPKAAKKAKSPSKAKKPKVAGAKKSPAKKVKKVVKAKSPSKPKAPKSKVEKKPKASKPKAPKKAKSPAKKAAKPKVTKAAAATKA